jgi:hypothetical protein
VNEGLVLLAAWAQWLVLVGLVALAVIRRVDRVHDKEPSVSYRRPGVSVPVAGDESTAVERDE